MTQAISSAQPLMLHRYADIGMMLEAELHAEASRLAAALRHFEATCREPGFRLSVSYLDGRIHSHAQGAAAVDRWVHTVGAGFERADRTTVLEWLLSIWEKIGQRQWGEHLHNINDWLQATQFGLAGALLLPSIRPGPYISSIVINVPDAVGKYVVSPRNVREWFGFSKYVTVMNWQTIPGHFLRYSLIGSVVVIGITWAIDWGMYDDPTERYSAMGMDAALILGTAVATAAAMKVAALAISAIAAGIGLIVGAPVVVPAALAAGAVIVVGIAAGIAITWAIERYDVRDKLITWTTEEAVPWVQETTIPWLDEHVFGPVADAISSGADAVGAVVDQAAQQFKEGLRRAADFLSPMPLTPAPANPLAGPALTPVSPPVPTPPVPLTTPTPPSSSSPFELKMLPIAAERITYIQWFGDNQYERDNPGLYINTGGKHSGIDFVCPSGTEIRSPVPIAGTVVSIDNKEFDYGAGPHNVVVDYGEYVMLFGHTSPTNSLKVGQTIQPGEVLANSGEDTRSVEHLHFEVRWKDPQAGPDTKPGGTNYKDPKLFFDPELLEQLKRIDSGKVYGQSV